MAKLVLDEKEMKGNFFADAMMIGIAAAEPAYRFCWLLGQQLDVSFVNVPESTICLSTKAGKETVKYISESPMLGFAFPSEVAEQAEEEDFYFPTYMHRVPNSSYRHMLYQLKCGQKHLLPEVKHLDLLWLIQTANPAHDMHIIMEELRRMPEVQVAQEITAAQLKKSLGNLLV